MSNKNVTVKQWECEACGKKLISDSDRPEPPAGWSTESISLRSGVGEYTKGIDICPDCAKDRQAAKRNATARWCQ